MLWTMSGKPITALRNISTSLRVLQRCHSSPENEAKIPYVGLTIGLKWKIASAECPEDTKSSQRRISFSSKSSTRRALPWFSGVAAESVTRFPSAISTSFSYTQASSSLPNTSLFTTSYCSIGLDHHSLTTGASPNVEHTKPQAEINQLCYSTSVTQQRNYVTLNISYCGTDGNFASIPLQ